MSDSKFYADFESDLGIDLRASFGADALCNKSRLSYLTPKNDCKPGLSDAKSVLLFVLRRSRAKLHFSGKTGQFRFIALPGNIQFDDALQL